MMNGRLIEAYGNKNYRGRVEAYPSLCYVEPQFVENAHLFYENRDMILHDSRMFLAPVSADNHLAYIGGQPFFHPILGVYVEWWSNYKYSKVGESLVYLLAGSPLSGSNNCKVLNIDGSTEEVSLISFMSAWRPFVNLNARYQPCKGKYANYSLEEVIDIIQKK